MSLLFVYTLGFRELWERTLYTLSKWWTYIYKEKVPFLSQRILEFLFISMSLKWVLESCDSQSMVWGTFQGFWVSGVPWGQNYFHYSMKILSVYLTLILLGVYSKIFIRLHGVWWLIVSLHGQLMECVLMF